MGLWYLLRPLTHKNAREVSPDTPGPGFIGPRTEGEGSGDTIFISYRRSDTEGYAGRLADSLAAYFGEGRVFRDVGSIAPGQDFTDRISRVIAGAGAILVLIGPGWLAPHDDDQPRLHDPEDYLAAEIATALAQRRLVVPVLVQQARMPRDDQLPERLAQLTRLNAVSLADETWMSDVTRLAKVLAMDLTGSVAESRMNRLRVGVLSLLSLALLLILATFGAALVPGKLILSISGFMVFLCFLTLGITRLWFDPSVRRFVWITVVVGSIGGTAIFAQFAFSEPATKNVALNRRRGEIAGAEAGVMITAMLALLGLSGFKPNDRIE